MIFATRVSYTINKVTVGNDARALAMSLDGDTPEKTRRILQWPCMNYALNYAGDKLAGWICFPHVLERSSVGQYDHQTI